VRLAVLGDPLAYTLSPLLHRAGLAAVGIAGESAALRTTAGELGARLDELERGGCRGVNLTHPLKEAVLEHLASVSDDARGARSVNTVSFGPGGRHGDSTDGDGFLDLLAALGREPSRQSVVLLGAGGAARSLALALSRAGAAVAASARDPARGADAWKPIGARLVAWRSSAETTALAAASVVVNATPLSAEAAPIEPGRLPGRALLVDLVYGPRVTPWVERARALGMEGCDGIGLLLFQARRSLAIWTGHEVPVDALARAVGWPR
jgi:shikimate dehydrogenase